MTKLSHSFSAIKLFENCPKRYFHQRIEKSVKDEGGVASKHGERVHKALEDRLKDGVPLPPELQKHEAAMRVVESAPGNQYTEIELTLTKDFEPTGWFDDGAWLRSKLDQLTINGKVALVQDWKTGKRKPDPFQLELFAFQVFMHYPEVEVVLASFVWLMDEKVDSHRFTRADMPALTAELMGRIRRIEQAHANDNWPARPSGLCGYCPCQSFCEFAVRRR